MTTTDKGTIKIELDDNNQPKVIFKPVNGDVWLWNFELVELFGVYTQTINCAIDAIYKTKAYRPEETCEYHLYQSGNTIKYHKRRFNLTIIIALAFRLNSWQAKLLQEWFIQKLLIGNSVIYYPIMDITQNSEMN